MNMELMKVVESTSRSVCFYSSEERDAWDAVRTAHDWAMIAFDVEELVALGIHVNQHLARALQWWHEWVSDDAKKYEPLAHEKWHALGQELIETNGGVFTLVAKCKAEGFEIERESELVILAEALRSALAPSSGPTNESFDRARQEAEQEYAAGKTAPMSTWGA